MTGGRKRDWGDELVQVGWVVVGGICVALIFFLRWWSIPAIIAVVLLWTNLLDRLDR